MKIICWNVNGIRALHKKGNFQWLINESPDIFCLQEVKANPDQLVDEVKVLKGYTAYFDWSKIKKGYSGVAVYSKVEPEKVEYGMGIEEFDQEGRLLGLHFKDFVLFNIYFPNGGGGPVRLDYKLRFYDAFLKHIEKLRKSGKKIVFCGDVNTAHEAIDLARPRENEENTGFLPEERAWLDEVVNHGYVDVFRHFYPTKTGAYTYWDIKSAARDRNVGWRIDYFFVSSDLIKSLKSIEIHNQIYGSDHCPIELTLTI
ncbi:MAG: exodeoxyribonuclease III [bacterium]|nr:exodeoxyribonuclease III [bacterium]